MTRRLTMPNQVDSLLALALALALVTGCAAPGMRTGRASEAGTVAATDAPSWASTLVAAQHDVERGRYAEADRALREFADRASRSPDATEALYWRAVFMLDPASPAGSLREAAGLLGRYLDADVPLPHRSEAVVLQRVATALGSVREAGPGRSAASEAVREAEMKTLKDELEQTRAELERIKKRLAPPPTTPAIPPLPHSE